MYRVHTLPTRETKELTAEEYSKDAGRSALHSIEDSLVVLQALRQSRQTWLTSAFTKFSAKSRGGKGSDIWQPPHTIKLRGKCDLEIGPHVFYATSVYEVTYQPYSAPVQVPSPYPATKPVSSVQATASQANTPAGAPVYAPSTTALVSSLKGAVPITSDLIAQVNVAASSNPTLANLLGRAASGSATSEQLQTLGVTIQSLADTAARSTNFTASSHPSVPPPAFIPPASKSVNSSTPQPQVLSLRPPQLPPTNPVTSQSFVHHQVPQVMQTIHRAPDVVIEFYENSSDRWTLPKDLVLYERVKRWDGNNSLADIIFSTIFPFEGSQSTTILSQSAEPPTPKDVHPITLRFFNVPPAIWNLFAQAAGDEERTKRIKLALDSQLDNAASRSYLQYRITDGALLSQLQASASDRYPTKLIRPAIPSGNSSLGKRRAHLVSKDGSPASGPPKRKRLPQVKKAESRTGTCDVCKRASIVLAPGSPYCPPCTKKVGIPPMAPNNNPSSGVLSTSSSSIPQTQANEGSTSNLSVGQCTTAATKVKKPKQPATPQATVFRHSPLQAPYSASSTPIQNYYAWQTQTPYTYHSFQPSHTPTTQSLQSQPYQNQTGTPMQHPSVQPGQSNPLPQVGLSVEAQPSNHVKSNLATTD